MTLVKMAASSPGIVSEAPRRVKKTSKPTVTTKAHRFEPFSKRISRLKIDPIHRITRERWVEDDVALSKSHFRSALDHWNEFNLSQNFTEFSRNVNLLCESLPQLLHHADTVHELLVEYIGKRDELSLEPLLDLVAQFGHDLGQHFEKYFSPVVTLVASVAATHEAPEVIEWAFTCLTWIFKFLSRLLVPDLRPLLGILSQYLGKSRQKGFVVRFAAESVAFLLRKAAVIYPKRRAPLDDAISYLMGDLSEVDNERDLRAYQAGLMALFSEVTKGVDGGVHSSGPDLLRCLLDNNINKPVSEERGLQVLEGFLINVLHQSDAEGFRPLLAILEQYAMHIDDDTPAFGVSIAVELLFVVIGTRKGSRVQSWSSVSQALLHLRVPVAKLDESMASIQQDFLTAIAMAMQYAPMSELLPFSSSLSKIVTSMPNARCFLYFCHFFDSIGHERFRSLFLPQLQQFIVSRWKDDQMGLCLLLDTLHKTVTVGPKAGRAGDVVCPLDWERHILEHFAGNLTDGDSEFNVQLDIFAKLVDCIDFPHDGSNLAFLQRNLHQSLLRALDHKVASNQARRLFALGRGFQAYIQLTKRLSGRGSLEESLFPLLCRASDSTLSLLPFLNSFSEYLEAGLVSADVAGDCSDSLKARLINSLSHRSTEMRVAALKLLQQITPSYETWAKNTISLALEIQDTPYNLENVRRLSMYIRRLPHAQEESLSHPKWKRMIPLFCFGLLSSCRGQTAEDVCLAIAEMSNDSTNDEIIAGVLDLWLRSPLSSQPLPPTSDHAEPVHPNLTPFQCSNLLQVREMSLYVTDLCKITTERIQAEFENFHRSEPNVPPTSARSLALRVLKAAPAFAEKRSRLFVPVLLDSHTMRDAKAFAFDSAESTSSHTLSLEVPETTWSYTDRKAFLELLGKFTNPKVLYRSSEVHEALLDQIANGSSEVQRLALKALFTWKKPSVRPYEERLLRLLDDKTFRDELAILFHADKEQSAIEASHRAELLPILLRLLFGQMISRSGTHGGQESRRKAILRTLFRLQRAEVLQFLRIAFSTLADTTPFQSAVMDKYFAGEDVIPLEHQYGLLRMVEAMMEIMQSQISPYADSILNPVLYCTIRGCRLSEESSPEQPASPLARSIRKVGLHCLDMLFKHGGNIEWSTYLPLLFQEIIRPRMATFAIETAQGISGLLRLFSTWSASMETVPYLNRYDDALLDTIYQCLTVPSAKDEVKIFVLEQVVSNIARLATTSMTDDDPATSALKAHMPSLAHRLVKLLDGKPTRKVLDHAVVVLSNLANLVQSSGDASTLLRSLILILREPSERISPWTKGNLLKSMRQLLVVHLASIDADVLAQIYEAVTPLFNYFKDAANRTLLAALIQVLSTNDSSLVGIARLCSDLNAYSSTKLDDVDFDIRLGAFESAKELDFASVTPLRYQPILYNLLYFAKADEDFAIRSNAVSCLRHFIKTSPLINSPGLTDLVKTVLLPALKQGIKENSETVRADHVALFGILVQYHSDSTQLADMEGLLVGNDEEASFFSNIFHIQSQRRQRAMQRLADEAEKGVLQSSNICTFFLPLLEKFIFDSDADEAGNNLKGQAIIATGTLLRWIEWNQFKAVFRRYKGYLETRTEAGKDVSKLLSVASDALVFANEQIPNDSTASGTSNTSKPCQPLSNSLPSNAKIVDEITNNLIPTLTSFIHHKDESQMSLRLPVAVTAVKLMKLLPEDQMSQLLPPVLLDLSYILRSRVQDSRDTARRTLSQVATILGPSCLEYILSELRTSLARGYQLHVMSYTVHSILKSMEPVLLAGDLDYCLQSLVSVVMDDIFGIVGQEKDNEDYISQMKEVKSTKSLDTMEMLAMNATVRNLIKLVHPVQALLTGNLNSKQSKQVDDLLLRIGRGLSGNPSAGSRDLLLFSYEVIQDLYRQMLPPSSKTITNDERNRQRFLVQLSGANKTTAATNSPLLYKLARFALDIVSLTFKRYDDLRTPENVHGFLPVIGDALVQAPDEVKTSALRLLSTVMNLPISDLDQNASFYVLEAVNTVKSTTSTNTELAQAALKVVTAILRERRNVKVRDADVAYLLDRVTPDLEEPSRQGVTFNFIKAVMARKLILPEVYDLADKIGIMMVTNRDRTARDTARGIYVHFLLQYPQKENRWAKQIKFLIKNLDYKYPEGRDSVMEAVNALLTKVDNKITQELVESFFMPVVLLMSNDDESKCREMAGALLSQIFRKASGEHIKSLLVPLRFWIDQSEKLALTALGMQAYKIYVESRSVKSELDVSFLLERINQVLQLEYDDDNEECWTAVYHASQLFTSITSDHPSLTMSSIASDIWSAILRLTSYPHAWVQSSAANLVGLFFAEIAKQHVRDGYEALPLATSQGLLLNAEAMTQLLRSSVRVLRWNLSNQELSRQTLMNLTFLGRCFNSNEVLIDISRKAAEDSPAEVETDESGSESESEVLQQAKPSSIPAIHYLLHQLSSILRHEPPKLTVQTLLPKQSALELLAALIPHTTLSNLLPTLHSILTPLHHLTDPSIPAPRNPSEEFQTAFAALTASAEELLQTVQRQIGDAEYVRVRTEVSRQVRQRREGRRTKRRIERVAEPEKAAKEKKRRNERKAVVRRERAVEERGRRRGW
jgi:U3 small nucleolar RNA-associated protein 20